MPTVSTLKGKCVARDTLFVERSGFLFRSWGRYRFEAKRAVYSAVWLCAIRFIRTLDLVGISQREIKCLSNQESKQRARRNHHLKAAYLRHYQSFTSCLSGLETVMRAESTLKRGAYLSLHRTIRCDQRLLVAGSDIRNQVASEASQGQPIERSQEKWRRRLPVNEADRRQG